MLSRMVSLSPTILETVPFTSYAEKLRPTTPRVNTITINKTINFLLLISNLLHQIGFTAFASFKLSGVCHDPFNLPHLPSLRNAAA